MLYLIDTLEVGGAEKSLLDIIPRLKEVEPIVCQIYRGEALKAQYEQRGVEVISLGLTGKYEFLKAIAAVRRVMNAKHITLVHATLFRASIVGRFACWQEGIPLINTFVNESYSVVRRQALSPIARVKHLGLWITDRMTSGLVDYFTSNSETVKRANCRALRVPTDKVQVIYRGREVDTYIRQMDQKKSHGKLPSDPKVLLNVGRLLFRKGQEELIRAMPEVLSRHPGTRLLIAGEGPHRARLLEIVEELQLGGFVTLLGTRHDIPRLLQDTDLFVSTAHYEGLPGAVVEALLTGAPVVLSGIDVHREMVEDGVTGRLVPLMDSRRLATTIIELLDNPIEAQLMGERGQQMATKRFDIDQIVAQHAALYRLILANAAD